MSKNISSEIYFLFQRTALHIAIDNNYSEIVKLLILHPSIDANIKEISDLFSFHLKQFYLNYITKYFF